MKVVGEREIEDSDSSVVILARNKPPLLVCNSCGKIATYICRQCGCNNEGWVLEWIDWKFSGMILKNNSAKSRLFTRRCKEERIYKSTQKAYILLCCIDNYQLSN